MPASGKPAAIHKSAQQQQPDQPPPAHRGEDLLFHINIMPTRLVKLGLEITESLYVF
eukprot:g53088.t1